MSNATNPTPAAVRREVLKERDDARLASWEELALRQVRLNEGTLAYAKWIDVLGVTRRMRLAVRQEARQRARHAARQITRRAR
jgi:hypothetical protein